jgi:hypothetical protein
LYFDRVLETSPTGGTGDLTLSGAVTGYQAWSAVGDGNTAYYAAWEVDANGTPSGQWETGLGTWHTGGTLSRTVVQESSNGNALVVFAGGRLRVALTIPAALWPVVESVNGHGGPVVTLTAADVGAPSGSGTSTGTNTGDQSGANPSASVGLVAVNGSAVTFLRSDGAPALDQSIAPTWTGQHIFQYAGTGVAAVFKGTNVAVATSVVEVHVANEAPAHGPFAVFNDTVSTTVPGAFYFAFNNGHTAFGNGVNNKSLGFFSSNDFNTPYVLLNEAVGGGNGFGGVTCGDGVSSYGHLAKAPFEAYSLNNPTNDVLQIAAIVHDAGSGSNGIGGGLAWYNRSTTTSTRLTAEIQGILATATDASFKGRLVLGAHDVSTSAGAPREGLRVESNGSAALVGAFGVPAVARQSGDVGTGLVNLGWFSSVTVNPDLTAVNAWTGQQYFAEATLVDGATINWNLSTQQCAVVTLGGNRTVAAPSNQRAGGTYILRIVTNGHSLTWNAVFKWPGGTAPTLSAGTDIVTFYSDGTNMNGVQQGNFS